jgi:hypothetical protein
MSHCCDLKTVDRRACGRPVHVPRAPAAVPTAGSMAPACCKELTTDGRYKRLDTALRLGSKYPGRHQANRLTALAGTTVNNGQSVGTLRPTGLRTAGLLEIRWLRGTGVANCKSPQPRQ